MPGNYTVPTRVPGELITADIWNSDNTAHIDNNTPQGVDDYSVSIAQMQIQTDPGLVGSENLATSLAGELERIRFKLAEILGTTFWYEAGSGSSSGTIATPVDIPTVASAAQLSAPGALVANARIVGVTMKYTIALGTTNGLTAISIGHAGNETQWGASISLGPATETGYADFTLIDDLVFQTPQDLLITAIGGPFDATGIIKATIHRQVLTPIA